MLSVSVQEQYEKMLKDYAYFLETAEGKLGSDSISARDLSHLKQQLSAHKVSKTLNLHIILIFFLITQGKGAIKKERQVVRREINTFLFYSLYA